MLFKKRFKKVSKNKENKIVAPMNGKIIPIEEVPDAVFSEKMMGEGVAIIPNDGKVVAPVKGEIIQVAPTKHAVGIRLVDGTELLIHIGLDTVALKGSGFTVKVTTGDQVTIGQPLIDFDLEFIRENAKDVISPIIITNSSDSDRSYTMTTEEMAIAGETTLITTSG